MMDDATELLRLLRGKGARIWNDNGRLCYKAPMGVLSPEDIAGLRALKLEVIQLLEETQTVIWPHAPIPARARGDLVPLTYTQEARWNAFQLLGMDRNSRSCVIALRLSGALSIGHMKDAFDEIVRRHEALRTRITTLDGVPVQKIDAPRAGHLEVIDLPCGVKGTAEVEAQRLAEDLVNQPIDMAIGPLFGARLLTLDKYENVLIVAIDHIVADESSLDLLVRDLWAAYWQGIEGVPLSLPPVHSQLADYAVWQREARQSWIAQHSTYWSKRLRGAVRMRLPTERVQAEITGSKWAELSMHFGEPLRAALKERSRREQSTLAMSLLTTYVAVVLRWCAARELIVAVMTTGRTRHEIENTIGFFASALYLRVELTQGDNFRDLLRRVTSEYVTALRHQDFGLLPISMPGTELKRRPNFNWIQPSAYHPTSSGTGSPRLQPFRVVRAAREMEGDGDLDIYGGQPWLILVDTPQEIRGRVRYRPADFRSSTMLEFVRHLRSFAERLAEEPEARVTACPWSSNS